MASNKLPQGIELKNCNLCQHQIATNALECPGCGLRIVENIIRADKLRNIDLAQRIVLYTIIAQIILGIVAWICVSAMH
jgi:uncharacterized membrane protein YvbJ